MESSAACGLALALATAPTVSRAAIMETIVDPGSLAPLGSITFPTFAGDNGAGVLFSCGGFTQADLTSISWTLDPTTDAVLAPDLNAFQGDAGCGSDFGKNCSNSTLSLTETLATAGGTSCSLNDDGASACLGSESLRPIAFVPTAVPEPSTWAMMLASFAGLALVGRRGSRTTAHAE